jgi:tetratricopeptide (TPR) repeat protein/CHAT domain-containing protein
MSLNEAKRLYNQGQQKIATGDFNGALSKFKQALQFHPDSALALSGFGDVMLELKRYEEAIAYYDQSISIKPNNYKALSGRGSALEKLDRLEEAAISYEKACQVNPKERSIWLSLGILQLCLDRFEDASRSYEQALKIDIVLPGFKRFVKFMLWYSRGMAFVQTKHWELAITSFDKVLKEFDQVLKEKNDVNSHLYEIFLTKIFHKKGCSLFELGRHELALISFNQALDINPNNDEFLNDKAGVLISLERYEEALNIIDQAIILNPSSSSLWQNKALIFRSYERNEEAGYCLNQSIELDPQNWQALYNHALLLADLGSYEDALDEIERVLRLELCFGTALFSKGKILLDMRRYKESVLIFDDVLKLDSSHFQDLGSLVPFVDQNFNIEWRNFKNSFSKNFSFLVSLIHSNKGIALEHLGQHEEAIVSFDQALELNSDFSSAWNNRGAALNNLGQYQKALESAERGIVLQPESAEGWRVKGFALDGLTRYEEAITSYDQALHYEPDNASAWTGRGGVLADLGRYEEAIEHHDRALQNEPDFPVAWSGRGAVLIRVGRNEDAISDFDRALQLNPNMSQALHGRGFALTNLGRYEEAIADYDKALSLKPAFTNVWINRGFAALYSALYPVNYAWSNPIPVAESLPPELQNLDLDLRGYEGCKACFRAGFQHTPEGSEAWGRLHRALGEAHRLWGNHQESPRNFWYKAIAQYNKALEIFTVDTFPQARLEVLTLLIRTYRALQQKDEVVAALARQGTDLRKRILRESSSDAQKQRLGLQFASFGQATVDLLVQQGKLVQALETAEKDKNWLMTWLLRWQDPEDIPSSSYDAMRQLLCPHTAIVYWHLSPDALTTFILRWNRSQPVVISPAKADFKQGIEQVNKLESWLKIWNQTYAQYVGKDKTNPNRNETWRDNLPTTLAELADLLDIAQINTHLGDISQLILVPHRDLYRLPLASVFPDDCPRTITVLPSLQLGKRLRATLPLNLQNASCLSIEAPQHQDLSPLPHAIAESLLLRRQIPQLTAIPGDQATQATVKQALAQPYAVIHFNGHAAYDVAQPSQSALALQGNDRLTVAEIYAVEPSLDTCQLVSLASCETAVTGNQTITTEYVGVVSAFLSHQIPYVLSTLWTVESAATALFILQFYQQLCQGIPIPQAFQNSQIWLRTITVKTLIQKHKTLLQDLSNDNDRQLRAFLKTELTDLSTMEPDSHPYNHPYYWAAFTLTGHPGTYE